MDKAKIADALIAHSRGILTRPQKEAPDTITIAPHVPDLCVPHVMSQKAYRSMIAKTQGATQWTS